MNTAAMREMLNAQGRQTASTRFRSSSSATRSSRRRSRFADLVLPDTTYLERHDVMSHARPADLRVRRAGRFGARSGRAADRRVQAVPGGAGRARVAAQASRRSRSADGTRKFTRLPRLHRQLRDRSGSGIGFLTGWRGKDGDKFTARRAQSAAVGDVRENNCVLHVPAAGVVCSTCATGTAATSSWRSACGMRRYTDPIVDPDLFGGAAEIPPRGAGQDDGPQPPDAPARAHRDLLRSAAVLVRAARGAADRPRDAIRCTRSRSGRWRCTTRGIRRTRGCARSTRTTTCTSIRGTARAAGIADGGWVWVESHMGQACAAWLRYMRRRRAGHGVDVERDRQGRRRVAARAATRTRRTTRLPAQPPDRRRAAEAPAATAHLAIPIPITGQAGWYDVRVRVRKAAAGRDRGDVAAVRRRVPPLPGRRVKARWQHVAALDDAAMTSSASSSISTSASAATPA